MNKLKTDMFSQEVRPTTSSAYSNFVIDNSSHREVVIWYSAGMEQHISLNTVYYREAVASVLECDVTSHTSFQKMELLLTIII